MVMPSPSFPSLRALLGAATALGLLLLAGCQTAAPVRVDASFVTAPAFSTGCPSDIAVLPIEDGTKDRSVERLLFFLRQEIMRQLPDRRFSPLTATTVDAALQADPAPAGESILTPATLSRLAGRAREDAVLAVRVDRWDESTLMTDRRVRFQFQAALVRADGQQLWSGTIQGDVKAGGAGAAPLGRDAAARSCAELAVRELLLRLPNRVVG